MKITRLSQSSRDRALWIRVNGGKKIKDVAVQIEMRGMKYADLDLILEELRKEGKISRLPSSTGEMIILKDR